ncbi:bactofilin family protein [Beggiatoa leptomitoformis]|uniref:Cell shape determination protein CcmA n=1 Tax=Beggiatoa leptomitoformis TaxID=288004 RepID=A0A2N9YDF1_9GAMM|nr:polymer-forming cytoskeletal protein [Beggiatoa leptomitoformis]ALG69187.1 cell shape determination protein CcmA [Beggiatoa leptomitoformis]AUI68385.1 cell shape determination protein CcmA [Beggiatoa leptomitoformis]
MLWGKKKKKVTRIDSLIGQGTEIHGHVVFAGGLHIDGTIKGNITAKDESSSVLTLSEQGSIKGEVRVPNVILNGVVMGDVYASEHIELALNARVTGNVYYNLIEMAMGAEVNGSLVHHTDKKQPLSIKHDKDKKVANMAMPIAPEMNDKDE